MKINCIIIDDEPLAGKMIEEFLIPFDFIELKGIFTSPLKSIKTLKKEVVDLIFLDIQMPQLDGFEFLDSLSTRPKIIITSAYDNYALKSYDYNVFDYLLKPFSFARFAKAIDKVIANYSIVIPQIDNIPGKREEYIFVNQNNRILKLDINEINFFKGYGDYVIIDLKGKTILIREVLKNIENMISSDFIRVHKSYIVSLNKIEKIEGNKIYINHNEINIGKFYKDYFFSRINENKFG